MLKVPIYIYETGVTIYSDLDAGIQQGYSPMYQKDLVVYKGVSNTIRFTVKNQDQKPVSIFGDSFDFHLIDISSGTTHLLKPLTVIDDGSTTATKGVVELTLNESDIADKLSKFYSFAVARTTDNVRKVTYSNTHFDASGRLEIKDGVYSPFSNSTEITTFSPETRNFYGGGVQQITDYISSHYNADPEFKRMNSVHTVAYYTSNSYNGDLVIQATLDLQPSNNTAWADIKTIKLVNSDGIGYQNIRGIFNWIRIVHTPTTSNAGTLDKIVIRS